MSPRKIQDNRIAYFLEAMEKISIAVMIADAKGDALRKGQ